MGFCIFFFLLECLFQNVKYISEYFRMHFLFEFQNNNFGRIKHFEKTAGGSAGSINRKRNTLKTFRFCPSIKIEKTASLHPSPSSSVASVIFLLHPSVVHFLLVVFSQYFIIVIVVVVVVSTFLPILYFYSLHISPIIIFSSLVS